MRKLILIAAASLTILPLSAMAQQAPAGSPPAVTLPPPPSSTPSAPGGDISPKPGSPLFPGKQTGFDVVDSDGISTKTIKAIPCAKFARETDGFTTCVGIPEAPVRKRK